MKTAEFKKLIAQHFSPKIRKLGWKGSGFHYRKMDGKHIGNLFGIQGNWQGGSVCCETAIHFDFMEDLEGLPFEKSTYASALIRKRLSPKGEGDHHWYFSKNMERNIESVNSIWNSFELHAPKFYNDFTDFPHPFDKIKPSDLRINKNYKVLDKYFVVNQIEFANLLKEINLLLGNIESAKEFSQIGIEDLNELAKKLLIGRKTKSYRANATFIQDQIQRLKIS